MCDGGIWMKGLGGGMNNLNEIEDRNNLCISFELSLSINNQVVKPITY